MRWFKRRPAQTAHTLPNGIYVVITDLGPPDHRRDVRGIDRYEVEVSRPRSPGHVGLSLRYFPTMRKVRAYLREEASR